MQIRNLKNTTVDQILKCFNEAFSDYAVPMNLTFQQLERKMYSENVKPEYSTGAFKDDELIGFILHASDIIDGRKTLYNGGTGIVPAERGQRLTEQMYRYILPQLTEQGFEKILLEVLTINTKAIKAYTKIGFSVLREFDCFKGNITIQNEVARNISIKELNNIDWQLFQSFRDFIPAWSNSDASLTRVSENLVTLGVYESDNLVGYGIYNPSSKRMQQFAIARDHRRRGYGSALFGYVAQNYTADIQVINVEHSSKVTTSFLNHIGLKNYTQQYEMALNIDDMNRK